LFKIFIQEFIIKMETRYKNGRMHYKCPKCLNFRFESSLYKDGCKKCVECLDTYMLAMYRRIAKRHRDRWPGELDYSFEDFKVFLKDSGFHKKYKAYKNHQGKTKSRGTALAPCIDRIDSGLGYLRSNIQLITQQENSSKCSAVALGAKDKTMRFFKNIRDSLGLTKYEMANHLGMLPPTYYYYEDKAKGCSFEVLTLIRAKLGLSWEELGKYIDDEYSSASGMEEVSTMVRRKKSEV